MQQRNVNLLIGIIVMALVAIWVNLPDNPGIHIDFPGIKYDREIKVHEGLDLQGGLQVLLEADAAALPDKKVDPSTMETVKGIIENRVNGLGVTEPLVQLQGANRSRIIVELPGIKDPDEAIRMFGKTGLLEFVDSGSTFLPRGTRITTDHGSTVPVTPTATTTSSATVTPAVTETQALTSTAPVTSTAPLTPTTKVYHTIMTGSEIKDAGVGLDRLQRPAVTFSLKGDGPKKFADFTTKNVGRYLAIVLDGEVVSCPVINQPITDGSGIIEGGEQGFRLDEAKSLAVVLKYGSLPVPLVQKETRTVGPTLGQESVQKSIIAGAIGLLIVVLFMLIYYRLPGLLADLALGIYALLVFALFKLIPVTLTLPGIAGFVLSIGMAVDANILIFERMKEEMRSGKTLGAAIEAGFARAWTSIRDSNFSTLITCGILYWFGANFGASIVRGFAFTLAIGVLVSMFTAITVTRTFLRFTQQSWFPRPLEQEQKRLRWLLGLSE